MELQEIVNTVRGFEGVLVVAPEEGSAFPELAWGDVFFYYAPDGVMPERTQPYGTIITKNYPDDEASRLDGPGRFRVNIHVGRERAAQLTIDSSDAADPDVFTRHPLYGTAGWVCVINPSSRTADLVVALLREAHDAAQSRTNRRGR